MTARLTLSGRIAALAVVNVALLMVVFLVFARYEFHVEFGSFLFAPARDRVDAVTRDVELELQTTPPEARTDTMARFAAVYGVDFYLFDNGGEQLAGRPVRLPPEVAAALDMRPPRDDFQPDGKAPPPPPADAPPPPEAPPPEGPPPPRAGRREPPRRQFFQVSASNLYWVGSRLPVVEPDRETPRRATLILAAASFYGTPLFFDFKPWLMALCAVVAVLILCWMPFIQSLTRTVSRITEAAERMAEGDFDHHLPEERSDELGQLSVAINRMAARLSGFVTGQKRFLGDIAHELCAPIARIQFALGILERRAEASGGDQREAVEDVQDEMGQMSRLVEELLSFSKAGMAPKDRPLQAVDVSEAVRVAVAREAVPEVEIQVDVAERTIAMAEPEYLVRAIGNLIRNAIRYAGAAGPVGIRARRDGEHVWIAVRDSGPGLPPEELDRVFTPFYRVERSRNRESGGAGLGLAIVKSCVEACRGRVECRNRQPAGLEVEIRLTAA